MDGISYSAMRGVKSWNSYIKGPVNGRNDVSKNSIFSACSLWLWVFYGQIRFKSSQAFAIFCEWISLHNYCLIQVATIIANRLEYPQDETISGIAKRIKLIRAGCL